MIGKVGHGVRGTVKDRQVLEPASLTCLTIAGPQLLGGKPSNFQVTQSSNLDRDRKEHVASYQYILSCSVYIDPLEALQWSRFSCTGWVTFVAKVPHSAFSSDFWANHGSIFPSCPGLEAHPYVPHC